MSKQDFQFATFATFNGMKIVLGTQVDANTRWARWWQGRSWFKVSSDEVSEF